jgi:transcriptional regulator with XRE-family HTH domain
MAQTDSYSIFARRFREARLRTGLSQKAVGIAAGIDEFVASSRVNQYERGIHTPDFAVARRLATVLGVTTAYLYADDDVVAAILLHVSAMPVRDRRTLERSLRRQA